MICYVYMEHESLLRNPDQKTGSLARCLENKLRLESISGDACLIQHYTQVTPQRLDQWRVSAVVLSGCSTPWEQYDRTELEPICEVVRTTPLPVLGICGGWQLIAMAYGVQVSAIRLLHAGEEDAYPGMAPGYFKEWGFTKVRVVKQDPLFDGLGEQPVFFEAHRDQVESLPPGFDLLASTADCKLQAARQAGRLLYGVQFHPERFDDDHDAGRRLLDRFFELARNRR